MEFHISRQARDFYQFDETLYALNGNVVFANFHAVRVFAQKINQKKDLIQYPETAVRAGQLNAMGLIDEILHYVIKLYRNQENNVFQLLLDELDDTFSKEKVDRTLGVFADHFPSTAVYKGKLDVDTYLEGETDSRPNREVILEEMLMLWLANVNPAFSLYDELFDDESLKKTTAYLDIIKQTEKFFVSQPVFGPEHQPLVAMLRSPALAVPHSLTGQLEYIRNHWGSLLQDFLYRLLSSLDLIQEEERFSRMGTGPGPSRVYDYKSLHHDVEAFSQDLDWMPKVVIIAKNTYVWLDQLSKKYQRNINRLDLIPDEELDQLARWGFTGLWLIGLWERSRASKQIKQWCGNAEAEASAYSLLDYAISADLGGYEAFQNLKDRAWQRGIRMAGDMVPNHVGIDGNWVVEHPDWFISLDYCPYPSYSFSGESVSGNSGVGIYVEDHYFSRSDAAVVFKRVDFGTGETRYIYHGNDGTSMPWNDTAQLDYLNPDVREAVIQTILHVAHNFPIIRFDAAMTLAKRHIQRLWYPEPGSGGGIPSRAEHAMPFEEFQRRIPKEFWREVVDRVAQEAPDTLLLAEAFWMLEGYFVRTLGMHRVYNSAFMNMLKNEENAKYRTVVKDTLVFDPEILKRFVNFMNNPDEDTAVAQFGKDDKYFGVCVLLATMPGLPMFGHGQIEGFSEKYGMEFRRAYWDESPDRWLIERHERQIFPLLRKRYLFSGVDQFLLYDLFTSDGHVDENVFAYSNQVGGERALVIVHNVYADTRGWIKMSVGYKDKAKGVVQETLGQGLSLCHDENSFVIFRDQMTGLEFIRNAGQLCHEGLFIELGAYHAHVFMDFRQVADEGDHRYQMLTHYLNGRGVPSIDDALTEIVLGPIHEAFSALIEPIRLEKMISLKKIEPNTPLSSLAGDDFANQLQRLIDAAGNHVGWETATDALFQKIERSILNVIQVLAWNPKTSELNIPKQVLKSYLSVIKNKANAAIFFVWAITRHLGALASIDQPDQISRSWLDEWLLGRLTGKMLHEFEIEESIIDSALGLLKVLVAYQSIFDDLEETKAILILNTLLADPEIHQFLQVNRYQEVLWFNRERYELLLAGLTLMCLSSAIGYKDKKSMALSKKGLEAIDILIQAGNKSDYQLEKLMEGIRYS